MKANLFKALLLAGIALTCGATSTLATVLPTKAFKVEGNYHVVCQPVSLFGLPNNSIDISFPSPFGPLNCEEEY